MSLLSRGPHTVRVRTAKKSKGSMGTTVTYAPAVTVPHVRIQPISSTETEGAVNQAVITYKVMGVGVWPGGTQSHVEVVKGPYVGEYDQQGEPVYHDDSPMTRHYAVYLRKREVPLK